MSLSGNRLSTVLCAVASALLSAAAADAPKPGGPFFTNSLGMEFVRVGAGTFTMGVNADPRLADARDFSYDEQSAYQVTLAQPFYILGSKVSHADFHKSGLAGSAGDVSWNEAAAFSAWLSRREGRTYRLPTEPNCGVGRMIPSTTLPHGSTTGTTATNESNCTGTPSHERGTWTGSFMAWLPKGRPIIGTGTAALHRRTVSPMARWLEHLPRWPASLATA